MDSRSLLEGNNFNNVLDFCKNSPKCEKPLKRRMNKWRTQSVTKVSLISCRWGALPAENGETKRGKRGGATDREQWWGSIWVVLLDSLAKNRRVVLQYLPKTCSSYNSATLSSPTFPCYSWRGERQKGRGGHWRCSPERRKRQLISREHAHFTGW